MAILPPISMTSSIWLERRRRAAHLQADVEALLHLQAGHDVADVLLGDIDRRHVGDLCCEIEPNGIDVGDDDMAGAGMAGHGGGHDADRPGAGDQHILADEVEGQRRVDRIAERIEDGAHLVVDVVGQAARC